MMTRLTTWLALLCLQLPGCSQPAERGVDVDVGGHRLHLLVMGEAHRGRPAVILESGLGGTIGWTRVRGDLSQFAQVVTYDRAGFGQSEAGPAPRDARTIVRELRAALTQARIEPPYLLVGQSLGGLYVQVFAAEFPQDTAGMVLVDPTHANADLSFTKDEVRAWYLSRAPDEWPRVEAALNRTAPDALHGFLACKYKLMDEFLLTVPEPRRSAMRAEWWAMIDQVAGDKPTLASGEREEALAMADSIRQAISARPPPKVPIILLAAGKIDLDALPPEAITPNVQALQAEARRWKMADFQKWVDERPGAKLTVVKNSGHNIEAEKPQAVIDAVHEVLR